MRVKDPKKVEALHGATVELVNEIGFAASSVSKIAKAAGVSPATIYTYFENKDDLLVSTYLAIMHKMSASFFAGLGDSMSIKDSLRLIWGNIHEYVSRRRGEYLFTEQFSKSPYIHNIDLETHKAFFAPLAAIIHRGIQDKVLKDAHFHMHALFFYYPILTLANPGTGHCVPIKQEIIEASFAFAWDAIKR